MLSTRDLEIKRPRAAHDIIGFIMKCGHITVVLLQIKYPKFMRTERD